LTNQFMGLLIEPQIPWILLQIENHQLYYHPITGESKTSINNQPIS